MGLLAGVVAAGVGGATVCRFRRDLARARARLATVDREGIATRYGPQEYAERGAGPPLLVSHGILHGCDGGLWSVRDLISGRRVIAPSRFGYLGSALPSGATPADQADAYALLLDHLGISETDVIGISAGATAALQFGLRHPNRVGHLVIMSGNLPGNPTATAPPKWARIFYTDAVMWATRTFASAWFTRVLGVPAGFPHDTEEGRVIMELSDGIFPVAPRAPGAVFDAFTGNPDVNDYPLEELAVPTLLIHARDDPLCSYEAAREAAGRIPGAAFLSLDSGGHLELGQTERVRRELASFLSVPLAA